MIYTSYFAKMRSLPADMVPIAICAKAPDWFQGQQYKKLAPKYGFFSEWKQTHDNDKYINCFYEQVLSGLRAADVRNELYALAGVDETKDICLLCFEKPTDFCHRHLVSDWLNQQGIACKEWE